MMKGARKKLRKSRRRSRKPEASTSQHEEVHSAEETGYAESKWQPAYLAKSAWQLKAKRRKQYGGSPDG